MSTELHIAGVVVHARPERAEDVGRSIEGLVGAVVHATSPDGKLVITLEAAGARDIADQIESIQQLDAVLAASLVYQHSEPLAAMLEAYDGKDSL